MITLFGSCRINGVINNNNLNNDITYTHSTKEVIQFIKFLRGMIELPSPYNKVCFRTGICNNTEISYNTKYGKLFNDSTICIIEICSDKTYIHNNYYLHHLCVDTRFASYNTDTPKEIIDNYICSKQTPDEIENDIIEIKKLIEPRKMIIVTHYNSLIHGKYITSRNNLINNIIKICKKMNIPVINPTDILTAYRQEEVITQDLGHYTLFGLSIIVEYITRYVNEHM